MPKRLFKFQGGGMYVTGTKKDRVCYMKGDIVESSEDLVKKYANKFVEVTPVQATPPRPTRGKKVDLAKPKTAKPPEKEEHEDDEFPTVPRKEEEEEHGEEEQPKEPSFGNDMTSQYPKAVRADLRVFFDTKSKLFTIVDNDEPNVPLNSEEIKTVPAVKKFLNSYLASE